MTMALQHGRLHASSETRARLRVAPVGGGMGPRVLANEVAVALSYNGTTQAVMMATPADLTDFAYGFTLTEGLADRSEVESVTTVETPLGLDVQIWLTPGAGDRLAARRRTMAGPVGCGLCGIDSLEQVVSPPPVVPASDLRLDPAVIGRAMAALVGQQPLHDLTRATHAAGFYRPETDEIVVREDVGRHNALDKLAGALRGNDACALGGVIVMTSRVSIDLVQKCARLGAPVLIAASAPTAAAVSMAEAAGITLVALVRGDQFEVFTHSFRIRTEGVQNVT